MGLARRFLPIFRGSGMFGDLRSHLMTHDKVQRTVRQTSNLM
jgi:hypothetical protein